jgi:hypothetical protein
MDRLDYTMRMTVLITSIMGFIVAVIAALGFIPDINRIQWEQRKLDTYIAVRNKHMPKN